MSFRKWYRKHRVLATSLLACLAFLALALYGWGVSWQQMGGFFLLSMLFLIALIAVAAVTGWLLAKARRRDD